MTAPNGEIPEGAYVRDGMSDLNDWSEESAMASMRGSMTPAFNRQRDGVWQDGGLLGNIANFLFGAGAGSPAARLSDGMTEIKNRLDLMEDVSGYGGLIMSQNHRFSGGNDYKVVPFNTAYGPSTPSVYLDTTNHRIYLAQGTWSVSVLLTVPQRGVTGSVTWFRATVTAYRPDGTEYLNQWLDWRSGDNPHSFFAQVPLIVPDDGYYVCVRFTHSTGNWRLLGGTDRSKFWVNRWDLRTDDNNLIIDPPDGPDVN